MSREIKFRAWDQGSVCWLPAYESLTLPIGRLSEAAGNNGLILMQYTGLKDKNGVEIYEGDIVTPNGKEIGIVKWWEATFSVDYSQSPALGKTYYGISAYKYLEVIGNIYEHPELLK